MKDLLILENSLFVKPEKSTENILEQAAQSYIILLLTKIGSISQLPNQGSSFDLGSINTKTFLLFSSKYNTEVFNQIREQYSLTSTSISDITRVGDLILFTVNINGQTVKVVV